MIVYRKDERTAAVRDRLAAIERGLKGLREGRASHEEVVDLFIEWGEFESAAADAISPESDTVNNAISALRAFGAGVGHLLLSSWEDDCGDVVRRAGVLLKSVRLLFNLGLPGEIKVREHEGYAHYGLYPETYIESARSFYRECRPGRVVSIGLRSIGTSLSLAAGAALEEQGCEVRQLTLRPRGHPFYRGINITDEFKSFLLSSGADYFLVIDEGPGLSGSSMTCAAAGLKSLGLPDERVVFFPSWVPDGSAFISGPAMEVWRSHRKFTGDFVKLWIESGKLGPELKDSLDISAGQWRPLLYSSDVEYPAVHPHHEKRKYLFAEGITWENSRRYINANRPCGVMRFSGLGRYGRRKFERALKLSSAGFIQPVHGLKDGFISAAFVPGRPVARADLSRALIDRMAEYLAFLKVDFQVPNDIGFKELENMVRHNVFIGLGDDWAGRLAFLNGYRMAIDSAQAVEVDGRMLPHEWIIKPDGGFIKADAFDHHRDQFFPCCQDIAWDVAGAIEEFAMEERDEECLISRFEAASGDRVRQRLPFYRIAYLAYRLGYCKFPADELAGTPDGIRFKFLMEQYSTRLKSAIKRWGG